MTPLRFLSKIEQLAAYLRTQLVAGRWEGAMPGRMELAAELQLNERTVAEFVEGGTIRPAIPL